MALNQDEIRARYAKRFNKLVRPKSLLHALFVIFTHTAAASIVVLLSIVLWKSNFYAGLVFYPLALVFVGTRYRALANILHESVHNCFTKKRKYNQMFSQLICITLFYSLKGYKDHHWAHHAYTGDYEKDLEFCNIKNYNLHKEPDRELFYGHLKRLLSLKYLGHYIGGIAFDAKEPKQWIAVRALYVFSLLALCIYNGILSWTTAVIIGYVLLPVFTIIPTITYIMDILDHGGVLHHENKFLRARNYTTPSKWLNLLFFPRNDTYHLTHHFFPALPTDVLPQCHQILMDEIPEYAGLHNELKDLVFLYSRHGGEMQPELNHL